jgi:hypothetical protein
MSTNYDVWYDMEDYIFMYDWEDVIDIENWIYETIYRRLFL